MDNHWLPLSFRTFCCGQTMGLVCHHIYGHAHRCFRSFSCEIIENIVVIFQSKRKNVDYLKDWVEFKSNVFNLRIPIGPIQSVLIGDGQTKWIWWVGWNGSDGATIWFNTFNAMCTSIGIAQFTRLSWYGQWIWQRNGRSRQQSNAIRTIQVRLFDFRAHTIPIRPIEFTVKQFIFWVINAYRLFFFFNLGQYMLIEYCSKEHPGREDYSLLKWIYGYATWIL